MGVSKGIRSILFAGAAMVALVSSPAFGQATPTTLTVTVAPVVQGSGAAAFPGILIGTTNNYLVTITNTGGADATGLQITGADLPPELELANVVPVPASTPPNPVPTSGCNSPNTELPCTLTAGTLAPGASLRVRFAALGVIPPNPTCPAAGDPLDPTTIRVKAANSDEASGTVANVVNPYTNLQADMTGPANVASGSTHTITTTVTNAGPCPIAGPDDTVTATFFWPASYTLLSTTASCVVPAVGEGETPPTQLDLVSGDCDLGPMAVGATTSFDVVVRVPSVDDDLVRSVYFSGVEVAAAEMQEGDPDDNVAEVVSRYDRGDDAGCSSGGAGALLSLLPLLAAVAWRRRKSA